MHKTNNALNNLKGYDILVLSPVGTYPLNQGNRHRVFSVCQTLKSLGARIHFMYYPFELSGIPNSHIKIMSQQWDSFYLIPRNIKIQPPPKKTTSHLIDEWWDDKSIEPMLEFLFKNNNYDIFLVNYVFMSKAFELAPKNIYKILDTHDKFSKRFHIYVNMNLQPGFFYTSISEEKKGLDRADLILAIKEEEEIFFKKIADKEVITLPFIQEKINLKQKQKKDKNNLVVGFVGSLNGVNIGNTISFIRQALPIFKENKPNLKIIFGGSMCYALKERVSEDVLEYFEFYGSFNDIEEFYSQIDVIVLPIEISTGLKIRAVEAFALGLPVVSHQHAVEGIPVTHKFHKCRSMKEIAETLIELSKKPELIDELKKSSIETYDRLLNKYNEAVYQIIDRIKSFKNDKGIIVIEVDGEKFTKSNISYYLSVVNTVNKYVESGNFVYIYFKSIRREGYFFFDREYGSLRKFAKAIIPPDVAMHINMENIEQDFPLSCIISNIEDFLKSFEHVNYIVI